jgi:hypothetical protein
VCYEAGPTGYVISWQLTGLGVQCEAVAPTLVPGEAGGIASRRTDAMRPSWRAAIGPGI